MQKRVSLSLKNALDNPRNSPGAPGSPAPKRLT